MHSAQVIPGSHFWSLPFDAAKHGPALDHQLILNLWIALALLVIAHIILFGTFRSRRQVHRPIHQLTFEYLPLAVLIVLFTILAVRSHTLWAAQRFTGAKHSALQVEVTGMQFAWYFRYPGPDGTFGHTNLSLADAAAGNPLGLDPTDPHAADDIVSSQLALPVNREVELSIRSQDVIHGFAVPQMRIKQNAVPGMIAHLHFTPTVPGTYAIMCTQLCGMGHYRMTATMLVLPQDKYAAWLKQHEAAR